MDELSPSAQVQVNVPAAFGESRPRKSPMPRANDSSTVYLRFTLVQLPLPIVRMLGFPFDFGKTATMTVDLRPRSGLRAGLQDY